MLTKLISGGQTGVDQAGLRAAARLGLATGGMMPKGFRTEKGDMPGFAVLYGMLQHEARHYGPRTKWNVQHSDGTVIMGYPSSAGCKLTSFFCNDLKKPKLLVTLGVSPDELLDFVTRHEIAVLNVAGNREESYPGIGVWAEEFLVDAFERYIR